MKKRRIIIVSAIFLAVVGIIAAVACPAWRRSRDRFYTSSCANHFSQLQKTLEMSAMSHPDFILPSTNDTRSALSAIFTAGGRVDVGLTHLHKYGTACPESFRRTGGIGYVYIGDGLRIGDVVQKHILVLFCPGENHRRSSEHCHAWARSRDTSGAPCVDTNAEMIEELKSAIQRGESGEVPYAERVMTVLREELAKRTMPR